VRKVEFRNNYAREEWIVHPPTVDGVISNATLCRYQ